MFHSGWVAQVYSPAWRDILLSLAFSLFPVGMFFGASLFGDLSDALGRRRTLMICMAGLAAGYGLMWGSVELRLIWLFLAGRLVSGLMAGTGAIAQAAMMDSAPSDQRAGAMAQVTLINTVGFVAGPAIGGVLGHPAFPRPLRPTLLPYVRPLLPLLAAPFAAD